MPIIQLDKAFRVRNSKAQVLGFITDVDANSKKIINLDAPTNPTDAARLQDAVGSIIETSFDNTPFTINETVFPATAFISLTIQSRGNKVFLILTLDIDNTSGAKRTYTFRLMRDGTEILNRYDFEITAGERFENTLHWVDDVAAGTYTYSVEGISSSSNTNQKIYERRMSGIAG